MAKKIKIAFADDSILQRTLIRTFINNQNIFDLLFTCGNGIELVGKLEVCPELPEACIIDLHMPLMNGIEAAYKIGKKFPAIKLFGYTSTIRNSEIDRFRESGVLLVFSKTDIKIALEKINLIITARH